MQFTTMKYFMCNTEFLLDVLSSPLHLRLEVCVEHFIFLFAAVIGQLTTYELHITSKLTA